MQFQAEFSLLGTSK